MSPQPGCPYPPWCPWTLEDECEYPACQTRGHRRYDEGCVVAKIDHETHQQAISTTVDQHDGSDGERRG